MSKEMTSGGPDNAGDARSPMASLVVTFMSGVLIGAGLYWAAGDLWSVPSQGDGMNPASMTKGDATMAGKPHEHGMLAVDEWATPPTVSAEIFKDPESGWNLHVMTTGFTFNAAAAGYDNVEGEGHAHIYVNGKKLGRLYGDWYHIGGLSTGEHAVKVSLNANDHSALLRNGKELAAQVTITVE